MWNSLRNGVQNVVDSFSRSWGDPGSPESMMEFTTRDPRYEIYWAWYNNTAFDFLDNSRYWRQYRRKHKLYCNTRSIYNPFTRLVDFYANQIYPGVLTLDAEALPDGISSAIPFPEDTDEKLKLAIAQLWQWWNWQSRKSVYVRYGAAAGDVLKEIIDIPERGKIGIEIIWPGKVDDLELDSAGNVKMYALEYWTADSEGSPYLYRKVVTVDAFQTFKDDKLFGYDGQDPEWPNEYGFVPATWTKHIDLGGDHGKNCLRGLGKMDELNSLASHIHDQVHKKINAPGIFWTDGPITHLTGRKKKVSAEDEFSNTFVSDSEENLLLLKGGVGGRFESIAGMLELGDAIPYIDRLMGEIERDHPELTMFADLRSKSQLSGPGATRVMGDVVGSVTEAAANYDLQSKKAKQMAIAIAGYRISTGEWGPTLNKQQQKFAPFDLESYHKGELDFDIAPRPLIPMTQLERLALEKAKLDLEQAIANPLGQQTGPIRGPGREGQAQEQARGNTSPQGRQRGNE